VSPIQFDNTIPIANPSRVQKTIQIRFMATPADGIGAITQ